MGSKQNLTGKSPDKILYVDKGKDKVISVYMYTTLFGACATRCCVPTLYVKDTILPLC